MSTQPTPQPEVDEVQHPTLGPLKFPKAMPFAERNQMITELESKAKAAAPPSAMQRYVGGVKGAVPVLSDAPLPTAQQTWESAAGQAKQFLQHPWETTKAQFNASPIGKISHGDIAGGLGAATPDVVMGAISAKGGSMTPEQLKSTIAAPVRGAAKAGNFAIENAPAIMTPLGALAGLAKGGSAESALFGGYMGNRLGNFANKLPPIPGEDFGLPAPKSVLPNVGPIRGTPAGPPVSVGPAPVKSRSVDMSQREPGVRPPKGTATSPAVAAPSEVALTPQEIAKAMGFTSPTQAMGKIGPAAWQQALQEWQASPVTAIGGKPIANPTVAPPAPVSEFPPIDFKQQQNLTSRNPAAGWRDVQEDLTMRDQMERNYGTDTMPVTKDIYFKKSDNSPVSTNWAIKHMDEVYAQEVPHDIIDMPKRVGQEAIPTSRYGRAVRSESNKKEIANTSPAQNKGIMARRSK